MKLRNKKMVVNYTTGAIVNKNELYFISFISQNVGENFHQRFGKVIGESAVVSFLDYDDDGDIKEEVNFVITSEGRIYRYDADIRRTDHPYIGGRGVTYDLQVYTEVDLNDAEIDIFDALHLIAIRCKLF